MQSREGLCKITTVPSGSLLDCTCPLARCQEKMLVTEDNHRKGVDDDRTDK